jgi:LysR family transcriptional regulator, transcriptional activator of nhaA
MTNLNYLRYFYVCAQNGSFTKAAGRLCISQPSLSIQIKSFEEQLGFHLFIRSGRSIQLTPKGQGLFLYASKIFELSDEMDKFLKKNEPKLGTTLKIGVSDQVERPFVADMVGKLLKTHGAKNLIPSIISKEHSEMVNLVAREEIDLVITNERASNLRLVNTLSIPVMLVSGTMNLSLKGHQHNYSNLFKSLGQSLILPTDELILAKETKCFLKEKKLNIPVVLTSNIIACITRAVIEKLGASFLPVTYVQKEIKAGTLHAFGPREGFWHHHLYLYTSKGNSNSFISSISKILQDLTVLKFDSQIYFKNL